MTPQLGLHSGEKQTDNTQTIMIFTQAMRQSIYVHCVTELNEYGLIILNFRKPAMAQWWHGLDVLMLYEVYFIKN